MPKGTVNTEATRYELKTLPGGFVMLKQFGFGQMLRRRDRAARYLQESGANGGNPRLQIDILNEVSRRYDFANSIVDHNIEDDDGNKLDFNNPMALEILRPDIAAEIERYIDELNKEDFSSEGFTALSESS